MSLKKIAEKAGLHVSTVSRIINHDPKLSVSPETRERVLGIAREMNYVPNLYAKRLRGRGSDGEASTGNLAVLIAQNMHPGYLGPFYGVMYRGIEERARELGYHVLLTAVDDDGTLASLLTQKMVDGAILMGHLRRDIVEAVVSRNQLPAVLLDNAVEGIDIDSITSSGYQGVALAVRYLAECGHRRIGYVDGWFDADPSLQSRRKGFIDTCASMGVELSDELIVAGQGFHDRGYSATRQLLRGKNAPTAILYNNDEAALDGMGAIRELGLKIPDDLSVCGFDDIELAATAMPPLTTVAVPKKEMGRLAVERLMGRIDKSENYVQALKLPVKLIERQSSRSGIKG